jgi:hypothetical protein
VGAAAAQEGALEEGAVPEPPVVMVAGEASPVEQETSVEAVGMVAAMAVAMAAVSLPVTTMGLGAATQSALVAGPPSRHLVASIAPTPQRDGSPLRRRDGRIRKVG